MTHPSNARKRVLFIGNWIPSFILGVVLPLKSNIQYEWCYHHKNTLKLNVDYYNLIWVVRRCDSETLITVAKAMNCGMPMVYEFDDRFDLLPAADFYHTSIPLIASYYWMLTKATAIKTYSDDAKVTLPQRFLDKLHIGSQYTPVFTQKESIANRWNGEQIRIGILSVPYDSQTIAEYNDILSQLKSVFPNRIKVYSFNKSIVADEYLSYKKNLESYYKKIEKLSLNFIINLPINHSLAFGKTPNKFREAGGFGYILATINSPEFRGIDNSLLIKSNSIQNLIENIAELIKDPAAAISVAERAYDYCLDNYSKENVSAEIAGLCGNIANSNRLPYAPVLSSNNGFTFRRIEQPNLMESELYICEILKYFGFSENSVLSERPNILIGPSLQKIVMRPNFYIELTKLNGNTVITVYRNLFHVGRGWEEIFTNKCLDRFDELATIVDVVLALMRKSSIESKGYQLRYLLSKTKRLVKRVLL